MPTNLKGKDILTTKDWSKEELDQVLDLAYRFKKKGIASRSLEILKGKTLELLFFSPSTRTRTSFTAAMHQLGGFVQCPDPAGLRLCIEDKPGTGESIKDTARVLERFVDAIGIRIDGPIPDERTGAPVIGGGDAIMRKFAEYTSLPIINLASDTNHPTQSLADIMVMQEIAGTLKGKKLVMMWAYSPLKRTQDSPMSTALLAGTYGMNVTWVYPEGYDLHPPMVSMIQEECNRGDGKYEVTHDLKCGLEGADFVFPRNWETNDNYIHPKEEENRLAAQHKDWKLTESLLRLTNNARFIHCMPFDRGNEVDDSVADGPNSAVYDEAGNLLHVRKAFLASLMAENDLLESI